MTASSFSMSSRSLGSSLACALMSAAIFGVAVLGVSALWRSRASSSACQTPSMTPEALAAASATSGTSAKPRWRAPSMATCKRSRATPMAWMNRLPFLRRHLRCTMIAKRKVRKATNALNNARTPPRKKTLVSPKAYCLGSITKVCRSSSQCFLGGTDFLRSPKSRIQNSLTKAAYAKRSGKPYFRISSAATTPPHTSCSSTSGLLTIPGIMRGFGLMHRTKRLPPCSSTAARASSCLLNFSPMVSFPLSASRAKSSRM
mmetsp:Transcript_61894/g.171529  ORF Transcript_61894/g.171529 Transcript_61894/m.171529 type:complete len:259 (-) Transcript_61894:746-1522(-)